MGGICGSTRDPQGVKARAMAARLDHRGPDEDGLYADSESGVSLGVKRLSIIDVEGGQQPLANEDGGVWASLNGEIYNHPSLRRHLQARGHRLSSHSDTEVLVHLYEEYGSGLVHALEGMFAFAIWDERDGRLLVGRDRFGEKPLFYLERGGELLFASELSALLAAAPAVDELDLAALDAYFVFGYVPGSQSLLRGVGRLPPGHLLEWTTRRRTTTVRRYWSPPAGPEGTREPIDELVAETGRLLEDSVRGCMLADVPMGVFLSGGVDSTLIAGLTARNSSGPMKTFTIGYDIGAVGESEAARQSAQEIGSDHHELTLTQADVLQRVPSLLAGLDQPLADQALVAMHALAEFARREVKAVIAGAGADELFAGYPRYSWLARSQRGQGILPAGIHGRAVKIVGALPSGERRDKLGHLLWPTPELTRSLDWVTSGRRHLRGRLYGPRLASAAAVFDRELGEPPSAHNGHGDGSLIRHLMHIDQQQWLPYDVLAVADRASMAVSLEMRTPYLHRALAEFAGTIDARVQVRGGGKALLRRLVPRILPGAQARRPKKAFRVPAAEWLRGPLAPTLRHLVTEGSLFDEGWFDRREVNRLLGEHARGTRNWTHALWPIMAVGLWLDRQRGRA